MHLVETKKASSFLSNPRKSFGDRTVVSIPKRRGDVAQLGFATAKRDHDMSLLRVEQRREVLPQQIFRVFTSGAVNWKRVRQLDK